MARLRGRALRGERCRSGVPHDHWKTTTFIGALRLSGMTAPMVLDGAMNGIAFRAYVEQVLVPILRPAAARPTLMSSRMRYCTTCANDRPMRSSFQTTIVSPDLAIERAAQTRTRDHNAARHVLEDPLTASPLQRVALQAQVLIARGDSHVPDHHRSRLRGSCCTKNLPSSEFSRHTFLDNFSGR